MPNSNLIVDACKRCYQFGIVVPPAVPRLIILRFFPCAADRNSRKQVLKKGWLARRHPIRLCSTCLYNQSHEVYCITDIGWELYHHHHITASSQSTYIIHETKDSSSTQTMYHVVNEKQNNIHTTRRQRTYFRLHSRSQSTQHTIQLNCYKRATLRSLQKKKT